MNETLQQSEYYNTCIQIITQDSTGQPESSPTNKYNEQIIIAMFIKVHLSLAIHKLNIMIYNSHHLALLQDGYMTTPTITTSPS